MSDLLGRALAAAQAAGTYLMEGRPEHLEVEAKSTATDAVTEMDRGAEALLVEMLLDDGPADGVLGEEGGERPGTSGVRWILDPLDGTVNYLYRLPEWAVSVAAEVDGIVLAGVVHAPALGTTWWASRGEGSRRAGGSAAHPVPNAVGEVADLAGALVGTGFGYDAQVRRRQAGWLQALIGQVRDIRRPGAAAIDLCRVADASMDGYYEQGLHAWDHAAAGLIVTEAGGVVGGLFGGPAGPAMTIAANRALFGPLHDAVADAID